MVCSSSRVAVLILPLATTRTALGVWHGFSGISASGDDVLLVVVVTAEADGQRRSCSSAASASSMPSSASRWRSRRSRDATALAVR